MAIVREEFAYPAANGKDSISAQVWRDDQAKPAGIVQIVHGMNEYMGRYDDFARFLAEHGYLVCGNDHAGHGKSKGEDGYGFFARRDGDRNLVADAKTLNRRIKERFPELGVVMLGHSMGSFVARSYAATWGGDLSAVILSGTAGKNPLCGFGILLSRAIMLLRGPKYPSPFLSSLSFAHYNDRYEEKRTPYDWISRDPELVDRYAKDEQCNYLFTVGGYHDLFRLLRSVSGSKWAEKLPKDKPYLLFSGGMDPVGNYSKGVLEVYNWMKDAGVKDVTLKIYEGGRHEMLNDTERKTVYADVLGFLSGVFEKETNKTSAQPAE